MFFCRFKYFCNFYDATLQVSAIGIQICIRYICMQDTFLYTRYPIVARALGLAAAECAREQRNLAYKIPLLARALGQARDDRVSCIQTLYQKRAKWHCRNHKKSEASFASLIITRVKRVL